MMADPDILYSLVLAALCAVPLVVSIRTIYSVYFGPLAKFPGPKLAAATLWYEFYYDVILDGQYTFKIKELHQQYGPIIRISPYELHIDEPDYYDELYSQHKPRDKYLFSVKQFNLPGTGFGTVDHKLHRPRRAAITPFFSKQAVARLQPMLRFMIEKLCGRIDEFRKSGQPMPMRLVYMCLTTDVITLYVLNQSWNHLDSPDFSPFWNETMREALSSGHLMKHFPLVFPLVNALPLSVVGAMHPGLHMLLQLQKKIQYETHEVIDGNYKHSQTERDLGLEKTVFHAILESDLPPEEKLHSRLWQEGQVLLSAGSDTTANTLTIIHFYLLDNPAILKKLTAELELAIPSKLDIPDLSIIERLPYLNAIINEGLRLSYGVSTRLQRVHPTEVMKFHHWEIPAGTPVGMTSIHIHQNATVFPEPLTFKPERWLEPRPAGAPPLDRYLVSFSKGSRQCAGMNLAKAELYLTVATVFRRFTHQELFQTTIEDVSCKRDNLVPMQDRSSKSVRVIFK